MNLTERTYNFLAPSFDQFSSFFFVLFFFFFSGTADKDICERGKMVDCNDLVLNGFKLFELTTRLSITPH